jgi:predicted secreted hydrolase
MKTAMLFLLLCLALSAREQTTPDGFLIPEPGHRFSFPADHGSHPGFRIEWWYVTGHLAGPGDGEGRFGFQATFFRLAGPGPAGKAPPAFSDGELHLAHMAVTDAATGKFISQERLNRAGWDASARVGSLDVRNGNWSLRMEPGLPGGERIVLSGGVRAEASFSLTLTATKPLVVFGENGVSRKGAEPAAASYYLTFSRLAAEGILSLAGTEYPVRGRAWMDHEISSSQLGRDQVGWDWVCVQLKGEPRELMLYRLRKADGSADPASRLQWVTAQGKAVTAPYTWEVLSRWTSPRSGATYPSRVRLTAADPQTGKPVPFDIVPVLRDQELANELGGGPYWEGACRVLDADGREVGSAYLELTGYRRALKL